MSREILFRGKLNRELSFIEKEMDSADWIYGWYAEGDDDGLAYILPKSNSVVRSKIVFQKTVGQYTGLKDKNGMKIFEGDILECEEWYCGGPADTTVILPVWFADGSYAAGKYPLNNWLFDSISGNDKLEGVTVVGNVYDNFDMLIEKE